MHFTLLLHLQKQYYKLIVHYLSENYTASNLQIIGEESTDTEVLKRSSSVEHPVIVLCDSDQALSKYSQEGFPVIAYSHADNSRESLMGSPWLILSPEALTLDFLEEVYCRHYHLPMTITETSRCRLRELTMDALPYLLKLQEENADNPDGCFFPANCDAPEQFLREYIQHQYPFYGYGLYAIWRKEPHAFLGIAGFSTPTGENTEEDSFIEISYALLKEYQHRGYMSEALEALIAREKENGRFQQIIARIHRSNLASIHLAQKLISDLNLHFSLRL